MTTSFDPRRGLVTVEAEVAGPRGTTTVRLLLDTGAAVTMLHPDALAQIGYDLSTPRSWMRVATMDGVELLPLYIVNQVSAIGQSRPNLGVLGHALPIEANLNGLLGLNFLRGRRLTIDFRAGQVQLE